VKQSVYCTMAYHGEFVSADSGNVTSEVTAEDIAELDKYDICSSAADSWSEREAVRRGVEKHGVGQWARIIADNPGAFRKPTNNSIKVSFGV
jgi:hypothetical protein